MDSAAAETHIRLLAESELRRAAASPRYSWLDEDFKAGRRSARRRQACSGSGRH